MPLDAVCLSAVKAEIEKKIVSARIDKVQQPEKDIVLLSIRGYATNEKLLICAGSGNARIHFSKEKYDNPISPPMFCMLLRKHLTGAKIVSVTQPEAERLLIIRLEAMDAMGIGIDRSLIIELMGRSSNIVLTDGEGIIIDCLRRVGGAMDEGRRILPGLFYEMPPKMDKQIISQISDDEIKELFSSADKEKALDKLILDAFAGISPLVCREICYKAYGQTDMRKYEAEETDGGERFFAAVNWFCNILLKKDFNPVLLSDIDGNPKDFSFINIAQYENALKCEKMEDFSCLLEAFYTRRDMAERIRQKAKNLTKTVKNALERTTRKLENQRRELAAAEDREELRRNGDIIMANIYAINRGAKSFTALDFYSEEGSTKEIPLDPKKNAQQNAAKFYKDYTKAKNAEKVLTSLIAEGESEQQYLSSVLEALELCENERDLSEIRQELTDCGYIKKQHTGKKEKRIEQKPMHFVSSSGMDIWVGKNNLQNDRLTMKTAFKRDIWFHAQKIHGSHVIISTESSEPDSETMEQAASLAAFYSQGRNFGRVPVDYTLVKYVKKPSGAKPGMVIYTDYKTIVIKPDPQTDKKVK